MATTEQKLEAMSERRWRSYAHWEPLLKKRFPGRSIAMTYSTSLGLLRFWLDGQSGEDPHFVLTDEVRRTFLSETAMVEYVVAGLGAARKVEPTKPPRPTTLPTHPSAAPTLSSRQRFAQPDAMFRRRMRKDQQ